MVRFKNRYLVTEIIYEKRDDPSAFVTSQQIKDALASSLITNFGDFGIGTNGAVLNVKRNKIKTKDLCVIRCARDYMRMVWASLTFITNIENVALSFSVLHVSGTLKQANVESKKHLKEIMKGVEGIDIDESISSSNSASEEDVPEEKQETSDQE